MEEFLKNINYIVMYASRRKWEKVKDLVENTDVDINSINFARTTALYHAALQGNTLMVEYLLSKGADINRVVGHEIGDSPLLSAVREGYVDTAKLLIEKGAATDVQYNRFNLLDIAVLSNKPAMIDLILNSNFGIDEYDYIGDTPLIIAAKGNGCLASLKHLLEKGADYRKLKRISKSSLLHSAASQKDCGKSMEIILKHVEAKEGREGLRQYVNIPDPKFGITPLHIACMDDNYYAVKLLLEHGAYVAKDKLGELPQYKISKGLSFDKIRSLFGQKFKKNLKKEYKLKVTRVEQILSQKYGLEKAGKIWENLEILY